MWGPVRFGNMSAANKGLEKKFILDCLLQTQAFADLSDRRVAEIIEAMCDEKCDNERNFQMGELLCKIGDKSDCFWYVRNGEIGVIAGDGKQVATKRKGDLTGEVGMINDVPRTATLRANRLSTIIRIKREVYDVVRAKAQALESSDSFSAMIGTRLFENWEKRAMMNVLDIMRGIIPEKRLRDTKKKSVIIIPEREKELKERTFAPGRTVMRQGEVPHPEMKSKDGKVEPATDFMYIVEKGSCDVVIEGVGVVATKPEKSFFGEMALLNNGPRSATIVAGSEGAVLLMINKEQFEKYFMRDRSKFEYNIMQIQRKTMKVSVDIDARRKSTSKRQSLALDDLEFVLDDKRSSRSASVKVPTGGGGGGGRGGGGGNTSSTTKDPASRSSLIDDSEDGENLKERDGSLLDPTTWLDWVPGMSVKATRVPQTGTAQ